MDYNIPPGGQKYSKVLNMVKVYLNKIFFFFLSTFTCVKVLRGNAHIDLKDSTEAGSQNTASSPMALRDLYGPGIYTQYYILI